MDRSNGLPVKVTGKTLDKYGVNGFFLRNDLYKSIIFFIMAKKKNNSTGHLLRDIFIVSLVAAFAGFMLGLIFAPQSGREFRKRLAEQFKDAVDRSKFAVIEAKVMAEELIDKSRSKADQIIEGTKSKSTPEED